MKTTTTEFKVGIPSRSSSIAHFLSGLDVGCLIFAVYLLLPSSLLGLNMQIKWPHTLTLAWSLPVFFSAAALGLAWWRPLPFLQSRGVAIVLLALHAVLTTLALAAGVFLFFFLARVLSGC